MYHRKQSNHPWYDLEWYEILKALGYRPKRSHQQQSHDTGYQKTILPTTPTRDFQTDLPLGKSYETLYIERKRKMLGEVWEMNPATTLDGLREYDVRRVSPGPHATVEIKADLRSRDRLALEHQALIHSRADLIAYWIPAFECFYDAPRMEIWRIFRQEQDRINAGRRPRYYRGPVGEYPPDGTRPIGTCIPIEVFLSLRNCQPA